MRKHLPIIFLLILPFILFGCTSDKKSSDNQDSPTYELSDLETLFVEDKLDFQSDFAGKLLILKDSSLDTGDLPENELIRFYSDSQDEICGLTLPTFGKKMYFREANNSIIYYTDDYEVAFNWAIELNDKYSTDFICGVKADTEVMKSVAERKGVTLSNQSNLNVNKGFASYSESSCNGNCPEKNGTIFCLPKEENQILTVEIYINPELTDFNQDRIIEVLNTLECNEK